MTTTQVWLIQHDYSDKYIRSSKSTWELEESPEAATHYKRRRDAQRALNNLNGKSGNPWATYLPGEWTIREAELTVEVAIKRGLG